MAEENKNTAAKIDRNKQAKLKNQTKTENKDEELKSKSASELRTMLSNKNEDYVFRLQKELERQGNMSQDDAKTKVDSMLPEIIVAQRHGQPANGLYMASPKIEATEILHPKREPKTMLNTPFWQKAVDSALLFIAIILVIYGLLGMFNTKGAIRNPQNGIVSLILTSVVLGVGMVKYNELISPIDSKGRRVKVKWGRIIGITLIYVVILFAVVDLFALKPLQVINPILPGFVDILIGAASYGIRYWFRKKYHLTGNVFAPAPPQAKNKNK